ELGVDPLFDRPQPEVLEPASLLVGGILECEVGQRRAAPDGKRLAKETGPRARILTLRFGDEALEAPEVELVRLEHESVARRARHEHALREDLAKLGDEVLERRRGGPRRMLAPEPVDQPICRHRLSLAEQEEGEQRPLLLAAEREGSPRFHDLERAEDQELRHPSDLTRFPAEAS